MWHFSGCYSLKDKYVIQNVQWSATHNQRNPHPALNTHTIQLAIIHYRVMQDVQDNVWCPTNGHIYAPHPPPPPPPPKPLTAVLLKYAWHFSGHHILEDQFTQLHLQQIPFQILDSAPNTPPEWLHAIKIYQFNLVFGIVLQECICWRVIFKLALFFHQ